MKSLIHKQPDNQNSQKHINDKEEYKAKILNNGVGVVLTKVSNSALPGNSSSVSDNNDVESIPATTERLINEDERDCNISDQMLHTQSQQEQHDQQQQQEQQPEQEQEIHVIWDNNNSSNNSSDSSNNRNNNEEISSNSEQSNNQQQH